MAKKAKMVPLDEDCHTYYCSARKETQAFMKDLLKVMKKHQMAILPTYEHEVSLHDSLRVAPATDEYLKFVERSGFSPKDFGFEEVLDVE